ncbi:1-phosphofructokinase family hexose kinase [Maledivibacter halophilus]|uniref:Tagatose-6-phosphate kinase n=1 Tax=Maledivibacter halophilus TaxID=36842 RepID=A0A1T5IVQ7_9FIRM|nr:1-phosphofructokinase family hexose kinase [Maledivibacter halophilus]SKC43277.1 tagatose 6-phosphate kinase [Maledivibacter halophilus]
MITTVTLNPAVDRSYIINDFKPDNKYRVNDVTVTVGGKGINVAKTASILGEKINATGFLGGLSGDYIKRELVKLGISTSFVSIKGESRNFTAIIDPINKTETTVNEEGPFVTKSELTTFIKEYIKILKYSKIIIASGSVPKGVPKTIYRDMVKIAKDNKVIPIIDASGKYLEEAIKAKPYMIKPNIQELRDLVGYGLKNEFEIVHESRYICKQGVELVVISLGSEGAIFATQEKVFKVKTPNIKLVNAVGSGDALVAGIATAMIRNYCLEEMLKYSVACGTANALEKEIGYVDRKKVEQLYNKVELLRLV